MIQSLLYEEWIEEGNSRSRDSKRLLQREWEDCVVTVKMEK
jgi:hypothetical protein